jgi:predicted HNH restriction endonuclease
MKYEQQLMTEEWQEFRERILRNAEIDEGEGAICRQCGAGEREKPLQIHHKRYISGRKAWEYSTDDVTVLCAECHSRLHGIAKRIEHWLIGLSFEHAEELLSLIEAIKESGNPGAISHCKNYARGIPPYRQTTQHP